jgi:hypothetical protein
LGRLDLRNDFHIDKELLGMPKRTVKVGQFGEHGQKMVEFEKNSLTFMQTRCL